MPLNKTNEIGSNIRLFKLIKSVLTQHLDEHLITYIRDQSCIIHQIDTLRHFDKYESPDEMLAIWDSMTSVLKRSCKVSSTLMEEFLVGGGYTFLNKFLLYLESMHEPSQAVRYPEFSTRPNDLIVSAWNSCGSLI